MVHKQTKSSQTSLKTNEFSLIMPCFTVQLEFNLIQIDINKFYAFKCYYMSSTGLGIQQSVSTTKRAPKQEKVGNTEPEDQSELISNINPAIYLSNA